MTEDGPLSSFAVMSRRRWLKWTLGGAGVVLAGGGGLWTMRGSAPPVPGLRRLSPHGYRTLAHIADAVVPRGGPSPLGAVDFDVARAFDAYLADEPEEVVADVRRALLLVEYGPVLFEGQLHTFSNLGPEARAAHWEGWAASGLVLRRQIAIAFRKFVVMVFYDRPEAWAVVGYDGPWPVGGSAR